MTGKNEPTYPGSDQAQKEKITLAGHQLWVGKLARDREKGNDSNDEKAEKRKGGGTQ